VTAHHTGADPSGADPTGADPTGADPTGADPTGVDATGVEAQCAATARRLADLGFTPGTVVEVVRQAPLRDPVIYRLKDYEVCLRRSQAAYVHTVRTTR
jgi:ferrous iron transport protein A